MAMWDTAKNYLRGTGGSNMMIVASRGEELIQQSLANTMPASRFAQARLAMGYYYRPIEQETHLTNAFSQLFPMPAKWAQRPKTIINLFKAVVEATTCLYRYPVQRKFKNPKIGEALMAQRNLDRFLPLVDRNTRITGQVKVRPVGITRGGKKRLEFVMFTADQIDERMKVDDSLSPEEITFTWRDGNATRQQIWTKEGARVLVDGQEQPDQYIKNEIDELPWVNFANDVPVNCLHTEPAIDLVNVALHLNNLNTLGNWTVLHQTAPPLFVKGVKKNPGWLFGANQMWQTMNAEADARFLGIPVNLPELEARIDKMWKLFLASWRIPESAIVVEQLDRSGVAIVEERESLSDYREDRARVMEASELDLIRVSLKIMAKHGLAKESYHEDEPTLDYTPPRKLPTVDEQAALDWQVERGIMTEEERLMKLRPGVDEVEAKRRLDESRKRTQVAGAKEMLALLAKGKEPEGEEE